MVGTTSQQVALGLIHRWGTEEYTFLVCKKNPQW